MIVRVERLTRTILELSIPSVMETTLSTLVYLVDTILIGWLNDPVALAAVGLSSTLMWATDSLFNAISIICVGLGRRLSYEWRLIWQAFTCGNGYS